MAPKRVQKMARNRIRKGESKAKGSMHFCRFWVHFLHQNSEDSDALGLLFHCNCTWRWFPMFRIFTIFRSSFCPIFENLVPHVQKKGHRTLPKIAPRRHRARWSHGPGESETPSGPSNGCFFPVCLIFSSFFLMEKYFLATLVQMHLASFCKYTPPRTTDRRRRKLYKSKKAKRASAQRPTREFRRCARATGFS